MSWFTELQASALTEYETLPNPSRKDENWRFGNIKSSATFNVETLTESSSANDDVPSDLLARSTNIESPAAKFVFHNDTLIHQEANLPNAVVCLPLAEAIESHADLVQAHFMQQEPRLGSAKFAALHKAKVSNGLFVYVPEGIAVKGTIEIFHWISGEGTSYPHTLIVTGEKAKVRVMEYFQSVNKNDASQLIAVNDLRASEGSKLTYGSIQDLNERSKIIQINETETCGGASAKNFILNTGAIWARNESLSRLTGEDARCDMLSVSIPAGDEEYDQRTFQHHVSRGAYSDLLYKNTLFDKAKTVFSGLIFVDENAHDTDAYQTCRNLFMSDLAEANSMPGLEINADQVKCSHGSTSAQVDEEEIYYLQARGIPAELARQMVAQGFSVEVIERLDCEQAERVALEYLANKFKKIHA